MIATARERRIAALLAVDPEAFDWVSEQAAIVTRLELRTRVQGLETHSVRGWEWDCSCDGTACVHDDPNDVAVSRAAVLALLAPSEKGARG